MNSIAYINTCIVCGQESTRAMNDIDSVAGRMNLLHELLVRFGGLSETFGNICNTDHKILLNLSRQADEFYFKCQKTAQRLAFTNNSQVLVDNSSSRCSEFAIANQSVVVSEERLCEVSKTSPRNNTITSEVFDESMSLNALVQCDSHQLSLMQAERNDIKAVENINHPLPKLTLVKSVTEMKTNYLLDMSRRDILNESAQDGNHACNNTERHEDERSLTTDLLDNTLLCIPKTTIRQTQKINKFALNKKLKEIILPSFQKKLLPQMLETRDVGKITQTARTKSLDVLTSTIFEIEELRESIEEKLCLSLSQSVTDLKCPSSINGYISQLAEKEYESLDSFDWASIMKEMVEKVPLLLRIMLAVVLKTNSHDNAQKDENAVTDHIISIVPKLCTVYCILMQTRNPHFCHLQQSVSFSLFDNVDERKVILNQFNQMGISISYDEMMVEVEKRRNLIVNKTSPEDGNVPLESGKCNTTIVDAASDHSYMNLRCRAKRKSLIKDQSKAVRDIIKTNSKKKICLIKDDTSLTSGVLEDDARVDYFPTEPNVSSNVTIVEYKTENDCDTVKTECDSRSHYLEADGSEISEGQDTCEQSSTVTVDLNTFYTTPESNLSDNNTSEILRRNAKEQDQSKPRVKGHVIRKSDITKPSKSLDRSKTNRKHGLRKNYNNKSTSSVDNRTLDLNRSDEKVSNICHICGKIFRTRLACKNHCRSHTSEKLLTCEICGKAFAAKRDLNEHSRIHTGECPYQCEQCGKSFKASGVFAKHRRYHASASHDSSYFTCPKCNKIMPMKSARSHMDSQCLSNECDQCHRIFSRPDSLALHKSVAHAGNLRYTCLVCDRKFAWSANLRIHMKRHRRVENSNESEQPSNKPVGCYRQRKGDERGRKKKAEDDKQLDIVVTPSVWPVNSLEKVS